MKKTTTTWLHRVIHEACTQGRIIGREGMSAATHDALVGNVLKRVGPDDTDRTREPEALRAAADQLDATAARYDNMLVVRVLRGEVRNLRSLATREERRRAR